MEGKAAPTEFVPDDALYVCHVAIGPAKLIDDGEGAARFWYEELCRVIGDDNLMDFRANYGGYPGDNVSASFVLTASLPDSLFKTFSDPASYKNCIQSWKADVDVNGQITYPIKLRCDEAKSARDLSLKFRYMNPASPYGFSTISTPLVGFFRGRYCNLNKLLATHQNIATPYYHMSWVVKSDGAQRAVQARALGHRLNCGTIVVDATDERVYDLGFGWQ